MKLTMKQIKSISAELKAMPVIEDDDKECSNQEAVRLLIKDIAVLQKRGYSIEKIAELLNSKGLQVAPPTLKSYMQRAKGKKGLPQAAADTPPPAAAAKFFPDPAKATFVPTPDTEEI